MSLVVKGRPRSHSQEPLPRGRSFHRRNSRFSLGGRDRSLPPERVDATIRLNRRGRERPLGRVDLQANLERRNPAPLNPSRDNLKIDLRRVDDGSDTTLKAFHMVEWNGKKYRLTYTYNDGTQTRQMGLAKQDWEKIAQEQISMWNAAKGANAQFSFSNSSFHVESGTWKFRTSAGSSIETIDFNSPSLSASPYASILPTVNKAQEIFKRTKVKARPMQFIRGNPPKPSMPSQKKPEKKDQPLDPLNPPPPPPQNVPWYRLDKKIKNLFKTKTSNPV